MALKLPPIPQEFIHITFLDEPLNMFQTLEVPQILPFAVSGVFEAPLKSARSLTEGDDVKTVTELCLDLKDFDIKYEPGNTFGIIPQNCEEEVEGIINRLKLNELADKTYQLSILEIKNSKKKYKIPAYIPATGTIRNVLLNNLDIRSVPKKTFLRALSKYTTDENELNELNNLCSLQGSQNYTNLITNEFITLLTLLNKFPSCLPPFNILLEHLPRLLPRPYSAASSPLGSNLIKFIFSLQILPDSHRGVCTGWLDKMTKVADIKIPIYLRQPNQFLYQNTTGNIIMICAGTGLAPFLSFLEHKHELLKQNSGANLGSMWLFYGCRYSDRDFLLKDKIQDYIQLGVITKLFTCFSRENNQIKYVQDNIQANSNDFVNYMNDAVVYVCGGKNMVFDVEKTITDCLGEIKKISPEVAHKELQELKSNNKYIEDVWI